MTVPDWVWLVTIAGFALVIVADLLLVDSRPRVFGVKEATRWVIIYIAAAVAFGIGMIFWQGPQYAGEFFAGYLTEYSLSVDNLFVFVVLMGSFAVPAELQHRVLLIGVVLALILRTILILLGAAVIAQFLWVFFIFGGFLIWTAWRCGVPATTTDRLARTNWSPSLNDTSRPPRNGTAQSSRPRLTASGSSRRCCWLWSRSDQQTSCSRSTRFLLSSG